MRKKILSTLLVLLVALVLVACRGNNNGNGDQDGSAPVFAGLENYVVLQVGDEFDPLEGVTATDEKDGNLTDIKVEGEVDTSVAGFTVLVFRVTNSENVTTTKEVYVVVGEAPVFGTLVDGELETVLNPLGVIVGTLESFDALADVVARENLNGSEIENVTVEGTVDVNTVGEYNIKYLVTNAFGLTSELERTIVVRPIPAPVFSGTANVVIPLNSTFDPLEGVEAFDEVDGDLTDDIVVTGDTVVTTAEATFQVIYTVKNSDGLTTTVVRTVRVAEALYAEGDYAFKFATTKLRNTFFAAAERYLLENGAGGIPVFANASFAIYSDRLALPWDEYLPVLGFGNSFGSLTKDDSNVEFVDTQKTGNEGEYTYRSALTTNPTTFNQWLSDDSNSSDAIAPVQDALYSYVPNATKDGYELLPSMAANEPQAVNPEQEGAYEVANVWRVSLKDNLKWKFHPNNTNATGLSTNITADDFINTYKHALDEGWFRAISGGGDFVSSSNAIKGAKEYRDAAVAERDWKKVGLRKVDDYTIEFEFVNKQSAWNVKYWLSSNSITPVHLGLLEKLTNKASYGTTPLTMAFTGKFYLDVYEADKVLLYKKNELHHSVGTEFETNYTGYNYAIIEDAQSRFQEFLAGRLEAVSLPTENFDEVKDNPKLRRIPGSTTFRLMVNGLGTDTAQTQQFPNSVYSPKPILSNVNFKMAMYHAIDRKHLAEEVLKTSQPQMYHFTDAYLVDAQTGIPFRLTKEADDLVNGLFGNPDNYGYTQEGAKALFATALDELIDAGHYEAGTAANPTVIELDLFIFAGSAAQVLFAQYIKETFEATFNDTTRHIKVVINFETKEFPGIYYDYMMTGDFDLAIGGISGSTLDAASFLDVYSSDNRGGFTLNWGIDTSVAEIVVEYTPDGEETAIKEIWSFDAIVSALNGEVYVENGQEAERPAED